MESNIKYDKLYYSISEVSDMLDINPSNIRFWEKEFTSHIRPKKNRNGKRMFTGDDIEVLKQIQHLTKEMGYTLEGARNFLKSNKRNISKEVDLSETLVNIKQFLLQLQNELNTPADGSK